MTQTKKKNIVNVGKGKENKEINFSKKKLSEKTKNENVSGNKRSGDLIGDKKTKPRNDTENTEYMKMTNSMDRTFSTFVRQLERKFG